MFYSFFQSLWRKAKQFSVSKIQCLRKGSDQDGRKELSSYRHECKFHDQKPIASAALMNLRNLYPKVIRWASDKRGIGHFDFRLYSQHKRHHPLPLAPCLGWSCIWTMAKRNAIQIVLGVALVSSRSHSLNGAKTCTCDKRDTGTGSRWYRLVLKKNPEAAHPSLTQ
ncbi:hypothetical protein BDF20DRAFT_988290 [Mycotypha africana]|uniref:uncharacterized protein n=1 Tax=Mycotypha africana TaxID=64632 RepID=UPI002301951E|nr:uncharacterized protein BDF20DRAFT_988290 [Mycotypha africana]KAI8977304.1 hypothetical protein BDF20DRAFT_988290 [Mycotypha africana]